MSEIIVTVLDTRTHGMRQEWLVEYKKPSTRTLRNQTTWMAQDKALSVLKKQVEAGHVEPKYVIDFIGPRCMLKGQAEGIHRSVHWKGFPNPTWMLERDLINQGLLVTKSTRRPVPRQ
jgi:hypothetical protein